MHACFHGGGSGSRITKSVAVIRDLTRSMKAITLKVKKGGGGRAPRRRRQRPTTTTTAEDEELQEAQGKDASSSASSCAKIAPHEEDHGAEKHGQRCDKCCSEEDEAEGTAPAGAAAGSADDGEWMAEPEPGVLMTLAPRGDGANYLRRIRFSEDHFPDQCAATAWWEDNFERIVELYSVVVQSENSSSHGGEDDGPAPPVTPCQSEEEEDEHQRPDGELEYSASCSASASASGGSTSNFSGPSSGSGSGSGSANKVDSPILGLVTEPNSSKRSTQAQNNQKTRQEQ